MSEEQLTRLIERAAEAGAKKALCDIGLHDDGAGTDIHELRGLLDAWREAKKTVLQTVTKTLTMALLGALAIGLWWNFPSK